MANLIVDTNFVMDKRNKPGWVVVDVSFPDAYAKGHIPGAVGLPAWVSKIFAEDKKRQATVLAQIEQMFGEMGIGNDSQIIVYGDPANVHWNAVLFWILEAAGCNSSHLKSTVQFYDGGIDRWQAEGGTLDKELPTVKPTNFKSAAGVMRGVKSDEILEIIEGKKEAIIVDTRTPGEYNSIDVRALRGGHIPGAVNIDFMKNFDLATFRMFPLDQLQGLYKDLPTDQRVITYCQTGARASYTYLVLRALGYNDVAIYHDGWRVYGSDLKCPVEDETWFDFTKINMLMNTVNKLQQENQ
ncbi:MAG: thiosulfate/3-mercaptopyruvate sulfurtransferase [Desulforhopalus sp.]|jgi:thiosulfate/3-mercaptopyruvate sulfurtransferase